MSDGTTGQKSGQKSWDDTGTVELFLVEEFKQELERMENSGQKIEDKAGQIITRIVALTGLSFAAIGLLANADLHPFYWVISGLLGLAILILLVLACLSCFNTQLPESHVYIDPGKLVDVGSKAATKKEVLEWLLGSYEKVGLQLSQVVKKRGDKLAIAAKMEIIGFIGLAGWIVLTYLALIVKTVEIPMALAG